MKLLAMFVTVILLSGPLLTLSAEQVQIPVDDLSQWESLAFVGETDYASDDNEEQVFLKARSQASASGIAYDAKIDVNQLPYLNWQWRATELPKIDDQKTKEGDDFALSISVLVGSKLAFWNIKSINYVWANSEPVGEKWFSPYSDKSKTIVMGSGEPGDEWLTLRRNVKEDFFEAYGLQLDKINGVAIMTDSDNSGSTAGGDYRDIYFSSE